MKRHSLLLLLAVSGSSLGLAACVPAADPVTPGGTGGNPSSGGTIGTSSGGVVGSSGGVVGSSGGAVGSSGGAVGSGGASSGGAVGSGGRGTGGTGSGGTLGTGGRGTGGSAVGGGTTATGGRGTGGVTGTGGRGTGGATGTGGGAAGGAAGRFSFFATSVAAIRRLSGSANGFGGDLRYGEATGIAGADKMCTEIANTAMPGSGAKGWRAFLSVTKGGVNDGPIHAIERIGEGPWYDRLGKLVSMNKTGLVMTRPQGADPTIINDLPNEDGVPNHDPDGTGQVDNHDFLTGTGTNGMLYNTDWKFTCHDWASKVGTDGTPRCGHSWPRGVQSWISILNESGCEPGIFLTEAGPPGANGTKSVGDGGGYGGIYCFALTP